jgi:hypothetical protein
MPGAGDHQQFHGTRGFPVFCCLPPNAPTRKKVYKTTLPKRPFFPYLEGMEVHFTPEQLAQLAHVATKAGTDAEHLVKDVVLRLLENEVGLRPPAAELPVWHLGGVGALHRRDIYDDVP